MTRERTGNNQNSCRTGAGEKRYIVSYVKTYHHVSPIDFSFLLREKVVSNNAKKASKQGNDYQVQHTQLDYRKRTDGRLTGD